MAERQPRTPERQPRATPPASSRDQRGFKVTPAPDGRGGAPSPPPGRPPMGLGRRFLVLVVVLLAANYLTVALLGPKPEPTVRIPYAPVFLEQVQSGNVERISSEGTTIQGKFEKAVKYPPDAEDVEPARDFTTEVPTFANSDELSALLEREDVVIEAEPINQGPGLISSILLGFGPVILLVGLFVYFARRSAAGAGGMGPLSQFSRSRARRAEPGQQQVTFQDVAGIDEAKEELSEIVDFLKTPDKYLRLGGRIPRGVLLSGPPGTGKTLLARAVAGEAGAPFFSISASEFVEAIVGVGASRVRDLFKQAKEAAPSIIFVDELDAIGRSRSGGFAMSGANDEREQTLNQILTEMDGFEGNTAVIVLAATNRPEILDQALLRPGRFDRRVVVQPPDKNGRRKILDVHTRSLPLAVGVDLDRLAAQTPGMVGADIANLCNEAALLAAKRDHTKVQMDDFTDALEKVILGARRSIVLTDADKRRTAYHEAGHALVGMLTPGADPVRKVSIIPRGMALGVTLSTPEMDRVSYDEAYLRGRIKVALGGRVAEEVVYGDRTTGAESDLQQLTALARGMVGRWGMSERIGPVAVQVSEAQGPLLPGAVETSEHTQQLVDEEVRRIVDEAHEQVTDLIVANRDKLDALTAKLLEEETLDEEDAYRAAGIEPAGRSDEEDAEASRRMAAMDGPPAS